jgi:hypothetical protein
MWSAVMARHNSISNSDNTIDSRDVLDRIDELSDLLEDTGIADKDIGGPDDIYSNERDELAALESLSKQASGYADDWRHGCTLIRESYFETCAREFAEDIGAIPNDARWPCTCIDWEQAARELQMDYTGVEFDGVTYYVR